MIRFVEIADLVIGFTIGIVVIVGIVGIVGCSDPGAENTPGVALGTADPHDARVGAEAKVVYLANCASSHGAKLQGQPNWREPLPDGGYPAPPHDGSGHTWRHSDRQLFEATKFGGGFSAAPGSVSHMPAFENVLSDDEIWATIAFVKNWWPDGLKARQRMLNHMNSQRTRTEQAGDPGE